MELNIYSAYQGVLNSALLPWLLQLESCLCRTEHSCRRPLCMSTLPSKIHPGTWEGELWGCR